MPHSFDPYQPNVLVAAGFHGEEPAGCLGLLNFLNKHPKLLKEANVSFLPAVNPTGLMRLRRKNWWGENPNRGFGIERDDNGEVVYPSIEGQLLLGELDLIIEVAQHGFLTLHEDKDKSAFFLYSFEPAPKPGIFTTVLRNTGNRFFPVLPDTVIEGDEVDNGAIFNLDDGSFESHLFYRCGVPFAACTETPGKADLVQRVRANSALINSFLRFAARSKQ